MNSFSDIVGQEMAKKKLSFYIQNYRRTKRLPHFMFVAERGGGKTSIATLVAQQLKKPFSVLNCSTIKNVEQFFREVVNKHMYGSRLGSQGIFMEQCPHPVTIIFDEASELPKDLTMMLLTALNPNAEGKNIVKYEGRDYIFDFSFHTFIFATTEPQKIFHALMDRCERVDFEPYSCKDLAKIVQKNVSVPIDKKALLEIASVLRANPRAAQKMSDTINDNVKANELQVFTMENWNLLRDALGILPLGVNNTEFQILKTLSENTAVKLNQLAAKLGLTTSSIQRHFEHFLVRNRLIKIDVEGRSLTDFGKQYMQQLTHP